MKNQNNPQLALFVGPDSQPIQKSAKSPQIAQKGPETGNQLTPEERRQAKDVWLALIDAGISPMARDRYDYGREYEPISRIANGITLSLLEQMTPTERIIVATVTRLLYLSGSGREVK